MNAKQQERGSLPGLGLVLALLTIGIVWTAVTARHHLHIDGDRETSPLALPDVRIDVNSASEAELTMLPGIGPRLAERIVMDRDVHGRYETLEELTRVRWIGPVVVQRITPHAFVSNQDG